MTLKQLGCFMLLVTGFVPFTQSAMAQSNTGGVVTSVKPGNTSVIAGNVFDTDGEPLIGATVKLGKDLTVTDVDGAFVMKPNGATKLEISYIGKKTKEVKPVTGTPMVITLDDDSNALKEVVVTGIVTKDKTSFTGSASTFSRDELKMIGVQNPIASLAALDPAFNLLTNDVAGSDPNNLPDINIRGKSSVIGQRDEAVNDPNQPLFIVDGFESTLEAVFNLDINRIESMTILKDAASTAIYGSKAANGVVVVETVKPKAGKLRLSYNGSIALSTPDLDSYDLMNASEKLEFETLAGRYSLNSGNWTAANEILYSDIYNKRVAEIASGVDTYWLKVPTRTGYTQKHQVYIDGGSNGFMFGLGANYSDQEGVMKGSSRQSYGGNLDLTYRLGKLLFSDQLSVLYTDTKDPVVAFSEYANANPYYKMTDENGDITPWLENNDFAKSPNPLYNASLNSRNGGNNLLLTNYFIAEFNPINELKLRAKFGINHSTNDKEVFVSPLDTRFENSDATKKGSFTSDHTRTTGYNGSFTAIYGQAFGKNRINVAADGKLSQTKTLTQGYSAVGFPEGNYTYPSFSNGYPEGGTPTYYENTSRSASFLTTINYAYDNRYLADLNYNISGSSVFGSNKKFINTWSVGIGWNIMNEAFFREAFPMVTMLKIRGSYGNPGNQDFSSAASLITYRFLYSAFNYFGNSTILQTLGNRNLRWQTTRDYNVGLDFSTDRWNVEFDYYDKTTDPLLISIAVPLSTGITSLWNTNLGKQKSKGVLASASYYILRNMADRFTWSVRATLRHENIKLMNLNGALDDLNQTAKQNATKRYYDGADPDAIWAVRSAGIDPSNGRELFITKDGEYTYDYNPDDEVIVGNTRAKVEGAFGTNLNYKGFSLGMNFNYKWGGKAYNSALYNKVENITATQLNYNQDRRALYDRWQKPGDIAQFKNIANSLSTPMSSRFVQRNNSLTLQSLQLGYDFYQIAGKIGLDALRINFYANDVFWLSTIKQERGTAYPFARSYTFALSFSL